jgi:zinc finger HIT domain-containing protein 1
LPRGSFQSLSPVKAVWFLTGALLIVSRTAQSKHTPNVRKILQSQKTFANHLDDYRAMLALAESNPAAAAAMNAAQAKILPPVANSPAPAPTASASNSNNRRVSTAASKKKKAEPKGKGAAAAKTQPPPPPPPPVVDVDVEMTDAPAETGGEAEGASTEDKATAEAGANPSEQQDTEQKESAAVPKLTSYPPDGTILPPYNRAPPPAHPGDTDPLLMTPLPPFPSDDELRALMTAPPLSYLEARATWPTDGDDGTSPRYPTRVFCAVCGYWGRVRCMKCGARVCALDCLEVHREECITRYGL